MEPLGTANLHHLNPLTDKPDCPSASPFIIARHEVGLDDQQAQLVGNWAEKQKVLHSSPGADKIMEGVLWREVPGHLQRTAKVPLNKIPNPKCSWRVLIQGFAHMQLG